MNSIFSRGLMLNTLMDESDIHMGSLSVLFVPTQSIRADWLEYERLIESLRLDVSMKQDDS